MSDALETAFSHLETILRYVAPGFVALFVLMFAAHEPPFDLFKYGPWAAVGAILSGILIHTIHTAFLVRIIFWFIVFVQLSIGKRYIPNNYRSTSLWQKLLATSTVVWNLDTEIYMREASESREVKAIYKSMARWTANVHFLYCTSYFLILIPTFVSLANTSDLHPLFWFGWMVFVWALQSDYQLIERHFWVWQEYLGGTKANGQDSGS